MKLASTWSEPPALGGFLGAALAGLAKAEGEFIAAIVAILARERALGHVCIALSDISGEEISGNDISSAPSPKGDQIMPSTAECRERLVSSGLCSLAENPDVLPLVLDHQERLYFRRDYSNEQRILTALKARLMAPPAMTATELRESLAQLGELSAVTTADPDWQLAAICGAAVSQFFVLTGGPGTGKTTTIARLITLLLQADPDLRIALAAPTGKAAARMGDAIAAHRAISPTKNAPSIEPKTLHRLLGYLPMDDTFRARADRPLAYDLVIVDEASMLDPAVFAVLLEALPASSRLVLAGDRDQLAAVAAGQVLGDLCRAGQPDRGVGAELHALLQQAAGLEVPMQEDGSLVTNAVVALRTNHRFGAQPGLDNFAQALARRDASAALEVIDSGHPDLVLQTNPDRVLEQIAEELLTAASAEPEVAIQHLSKLRILAATRHGIMGTEAWNRRVETMLESHGIRIDDPWYPGRPILVTANDQQNRIWNGDLGIACRDARARPQVAFRSQDGGVRFISAFRVPAHETAWAMTVHKAQGSEFDTVILSMPETDGPLWQAPLIYTGITRAKKHAVLLADRSLLTTGLARWPKRSSGLADGLALLRAGSQ